MLVTRTAVSIGMGFTYFVNTRMFLHEDKGLPEYLNIHQHSYEKFRSYYVLTHVLGHAD
jgi:hypothetical protein